MSDKVIPLHPAETLAEVGGPVDRATVTLALYSDNLKSDEVTQLLGCEPTRTYPKGHLKSPRAKPLPRGVWLRTVEGKAPIGPDSLIASLLDDLPRDQAFWKSLISKYEVRISVGIHTTGWNRGFGLKPTTLSRIAETGMELDFDLYMESDA